MDQGHLISVLLSWAVQLTSYSHPHTVPNDKCRAAAWYNNDGTIYINNILEGKTDSMTRGVIVHELVHYLQDLSGKFKNKDCQDHQVREREAYAIQRAYLHTVAGDFIAIYMDYPPCSG
jgi:predicted SprT family Zn-dependent metalloprotease